MFGVVCYKVTEFLLFGLAERYEFSREGCWSSWFEVDHMVPYSRWWELMGCFF
jgi:hypothetical protein